MKKCCKCGETKPPDEFHKDRRATDGLQSRCKECRKVYAAQHKEGRAVYDKAYRAAHASERAAYNKTWRVGNADEIAAKQKAWRAANAEDLAAKKAAYRAKNKGKIAARVAAWQKANPEKRVASEQRRRARLANVVSEDFDITDLFKRDGQKCCYCGATERLTTEHVIPISEGGPNTLDNCVVACRSCNSSKGARPLIGWLTTTNKLDALTQGALL